jgi:hypothetical protein
MFLVSRREFRTPAQEKSNLAPRRLGWQTMYRAAPRNAGPAQARHAASAGDLSVIGRCRDLDVVCALSLATTDPTLRQLEVDRAPTREHH